MKAQTNAFISLSLSLIVIFSLSIAGCEGPAGTEGSIGPEGPIGPAGENGSVIHAGQGAPDVSIGEIGDYYLDTQNTLLHGPKTEGNWGTPIDLKGADGQDGSDGQDGADGSQIFSGTTAPDPSLGDSGDYYLNTSNFDLYGPKTESGWGTPVNLQATTNVMYSAWFGVVWNDLNDPEFKTMRIQEFRITREFLNSGGNVHMYLKQEFTDVFTVLPLPLVSGNETLRYGAAVVDPPSDFNGIILVHESLDGVTVVTDFTAPEFEVRYVLIPGSENISPKSRTENSPINMKDYEQVQKYFGIRDLPQPVSSSLE